MINESVIIQPFGFVVITEYSPAISPDILFWDPIILVVESNQEYEKFVVSG